MVTVIAVPNMAGEGPGATTTHGPPGEMASVSVKTTLPAVPYPPHAAREPILTERLLLRPVVESDVEALHVLRTQPEVMINTSQGCVDADMETTRYYVIGKLSPDTTYNFAICLAATGEVVGQGGCFLRKGSMGWPEVGYMLRRELWGKGYASEFMRGFLSAWWSLPREEIDIEVAKETVVADGPAAAAECLGAITVEDNLASQRVLEKSGMNKVREWSEEDLRGGGMITLYGFTCRKPNDG